MKGTVLSDAREFGAHLRQGGWRLGLLVARNVVRAKAADGKVPAAEFAREAGTTGGRVTRFLDAWDKAAEAGLVPAAATLKPGKEVRLDAEKLPPWGEFYVLPQSNTASTGLIAKGLEQATPAKLAKVVEALPPQTRAALVTEVLGGQSQEQVERVVGALPAKQQQALGAAAGNRYDAARQNYDERERGLSEGERRERDEATRKMRNAAAAAAAPFATAGIVSHLEQATEELNELAADASLTESHIRRIEGALDGFVSALDFARNLAGVTRGE
jgi:hypothetical protein